MGTWRAREDELCGWRGDVSAGVSTHNTAPGIRHTSDGEQRVQGAIEYSGVLHGTLDSVLDAAQRRAHRDNTCVPPLEQALHQWGNLCLVDVVLWHGGVVHVVELECLAVLTHIALVQCQTPGVCPLVVVHGWLQIRVGGESFIP